jgi:hypothetical protein
VPGRLGAIVPNQYLGDEANIVAKRVKVTD